MRARRVLLARDNFGCGSSREHAPWALEDYGIRAIIAPSFRRHLLQQLLQERHPADRARRRRGRPPVPRMRASEGYRLSVDLEKQTVTTPGGEVLAFEVDGGRKHRLLNGLDDIGLTLLQADKIKAYEERASRKRRGCSEAPWLFTDRAFNNENCSLAG
jgi:3-isopropylmalate/(R)-2-methylmalate dehydratase small subunit